MSANELLQVSGKVPERVPPLLYYVLRARIALAITHCWRQHLPEHLAVS